MCQRHLGRSVCAALLLAACGGVAVPTEKLASSTWLGSALIVSDEAPYRETAAGTDFLVVLSNEPQGALKIRSPEESRPTAQIPRLNQPVRAYRAPQEDRHFRHPLGSFFP